MLFILQLNLANSKSWRLSWKLSIERFESQKLDWKKNQRVVHMIWMYSNYRGFPKFYITCENCDYTPWDLKIASRNLVLFIILEGYIQGATCGHIFKMFEFFILYPRSNIEQKFWILDSRSKIIMLSITQHNNKNINFGNTKNSI